MKTITITDSSQLYPPHPLDSGCCCQRLLMWKYHCCLAPNILHGQGHARKYPCLQGNTQGTCLYNMSVASPMWTDMTALGRIKPVTLPFAVSKSNSVKQPFFFRMVTYCPEMLLQCSHIRSSPNIQSPRSPQDPTQNQQISSTNRTPPADITSLLLLSSIAKTPCQASGLF